MFALGENEADGNGRLKTPDWMENMFIGACWLQYDGSGNV